jgi:mRNA export factor
MFFSADERARGSESKEHPFWMSSLKKEETRVCDTVVNPNNDPALVGAPPDTVTQLAWAPNSQWLAASSWANQLRLWEMKDGMMNIPRFVFRMTVPVLSCTWPSAEGIAFGLLDGTVAGLPLSTCQSTVLYKHASAVSCMTTLVDHNTIVSGSWDHTVKLYDIRSNKTVKDTFLSDEVFCLDLKQHLLIVGTADREVSTWDIRKMDNALHGHTIEHSLQIRSIALMNDLSGYVQGSLNGRCSVVYYGEGDAFKEQRNYAFRCHTQRVGSDVQELHAVNALCYHPTETDLLATCGSEGRFSVWNTKHKMHIMSLPSLLNMPLTAFQWAPNGKSAVYAAGNDFSHATTSSFSKIYWHAWESDSSDH